MSAFAASSNLIEEEERKIHLSRVQITAYYVALPLVLGFSLVDYVLIDSAWLNLLYVRLCIIPVIGIIYFLFKWRNALLQKHYWIPGMILLSYLGLYSTYLCHKTGGPVSPYYAGINLIMMGTSVFLPWKRNHLYLTYLVMLLPFSVYAALTLKSSEFAIFASNFSFILATGFMCTVLHGLNHKLRRSEIRIRSELNREIVTKEAIIAKKTKEGVELERLASQFSPQVIQAIKSGDLRLSERVRRVITCIFLDIENSTARSTRLDSHAFDEVVTDFLSSSIDILHKHNVTVGTFLGDGILAFSNAPIDVKDHRERALNSCLEILEYRHRIASYYSSKWRSEFNIRLGIHSGEANCGFYPNDQIGTYTAFGENVSLTSRLCSVAAPNTICTTKEFVALARPKSHQVKMDSLGHLETLKGFEGESFHLYSIRPSVSAMPTSEDNCPLCSAPLATVEHYESSALVKCTRCAYHDLVDLGDAVPSGSGKIAS